MLSTNSDTGILECSPRFCISTRLSGDPNAVGQGTMGRHFVVLDYTQGRWMNLNFGMNWNFTWNDQDTKEYMQLWSYLCNCESKQSGNNIWLKDPFTCGRTIKKSKGIINTKYRVAVTADGAEGGSIWRGTLRDFRWTRSSYILLIDESMNILFMTSKVRTYVMGTSVCLGNILWRKDEAAIRGQRDWERSRKRINAQSNIFCLSVPNINQSLLNPKSQREIRISSCP